MLRFVVFRGICSSRSIVLNQRHDAVIRRFATSDPAEEMLKQNNDMPSEKKLYESLAAEMEKDAKSLESAKLMDSIIILHLVQYAESQKSQTKDLILRMCELKERWPIEVSEVVSMKLQNATRIQEFLGLRSEARKKVEEAVKLCDKHNLHDAASVKARLQLFRIFLSDAEEQGIQLDPKGKKLVDLALSDARLLSRNEKEHKILIGESEVERASLAVREGDFEQAVKLFEDAVLLLENVYREDHPRLFIGKSLYCHSLNMCGFTQRSEVVARDLWELR